MKYTIALLLPLALLSLPAGAQDIRSNRSLCPHCKNTGRLPNPAFDSQKLLEEKVRFCSFTMESDKNGLGNPWLPCVKCRNPDVQAKAEAEFKKVIGVRKEWLAERREIDKFLKVKKPLYHLETEHFVWAWDIPKLKAGRKTYDAHGSLHLYASRMEKFYSDFLERHKITPGDNLYNFHQLYVFRRQKTAQAATGKYAQQYSISGRMTKPGYQSAVVTWWDKSMMPTDEDLFRYLVHNVTHLFTSSYKTGHWCYQTGMVYEGIAHWWEIYYTKTATIYCQQERNKLTDWITEDWKLKVRKLVRGDRVPPLTEMLMTNGGSLVGKEHVYGWSVMDYMIYMDSKKTLDFIALLKDKKPPRDAFMEIWGRSLLSFEEQWKEYVKTKY